MYVKTIIDQFHHLSDTHLVHIEIQNNVQISLYFMPKKKIRVKLRKKYLIVKGKMDLGFLEINRVVTGTAEIILGLSD